MIRTSIIENADFLTRKEKQKVELFFHFHSKYLSPNPSHHISSSCYMHSSLLRHLPPQLLTPQHRRPYRFVNNTLQPTRPETLQRGMRGAIRTGDVPAQLRRLLRGGNQHATGSHARLRGEARGLLQRQTLRDRAGD